MKWPFHWGYFREDLKAGVSYMLLSSFMLSLFSLFGKFATETTPFLLLTFLRFVIPLLIMLPIFLWKSTLKELFATSQLKLQMLRSLCMIVYQYSIFYYLIHASVLDATVLQNTFPLFLPILEKIFFNHHFDRREITSILICFVGVLCILQPDLGILENLGIVVLLAPLSQAGSQLLFAHQARQENHRSTLFYLYFFCSIVSGAIFFLFPNAVPEKLSSNHGFLFTWGSIFGLGIVSIFNQYFRGKAYESCKPSSLSPFLYFSLIVSGFLEWVIFGNWPNLLSVAGAVLVICGGLMQLWKGKRVIDGQR